MNQYEQQDIRPKKRMLHCGYSQQQINLSQELCLLAIQAPFIHQDMHRLIYFSFHISIMTSNTTLVIT